MKQCFNRVKCCACLPCNSKILWLFGGNYCMLRLKAAAAGLRPTLLLLLLLWSDPLCCKPTTCCYLGAASTTKALQQNKYESTGHRFSGSIECGFEWSLIIDSFHQVCEKKHENMSPMETRCWILDGRQCQMRSAKILWDRRGGSGGREPL